jgi:ABC-type dipeptide/oligopeptide/nickel transport system ATPase component
LSGSARADRGRLDPPDGIDLLKLSQGHAQLRGKEIRFIFQDPLTSLNPTLTIGYQIGRRSRAWACRPRRQGRSPTARQVSIPRPADRLNDYQFSGGMRQRAVIAIALSCDRS